MGINSIRSNLHFYLMTTGKTLKDLKVQVLLIFCLKLIREYTQTEDNKISSGYSDYMSNKEENLIYTKMKELENYLLKRVYTIEEIHNIMNDKSSKESITKAILLEPTTYFYEIVVKRFISKMNSLSGDGKKYYIPELLALYLMIDMREKGYGLKKLSFIEEFDFLDFIEIYNKVNIEVKRTNNIKMITTPLINQTTISKMQHLSLYLTEILIEAKYSKK
ncbi:hypothetical protein [Aliarcobacter butzleri]|uniref:hypothetical protein n=1 Tax=Aliarcobacter butzleri TaxID=28197 RepID=UPI0021B5E67C|nr:hypothetical protein [Aliarcobacter butzleri]MCT7579245.1 hypothetical protein [Aliarcobacter butzleri]